eukprot:TRINITY_DN13977_c0_g1_i3.p1 TRINITY_DN13977_c0_g1~~TRINITY_DN13977_c0_g1_i3.p1  ORF type:complete len:1116 (+),score=214.37 TRINITY_DN13977_c0_g1_i3:394-3348(+)
MVLSNTVKSNAEIHLDFDSAEAFGRKILGADSWVERLFKECDGPATGFLWPAEFAALAFRFEQAMGGFHGRFKFSFAEADLSLEGRVTLQEWTEYSARLVDVFGETRCRIAAQRVLGSRKAEARKKVKKLFTFEGFDRSASVRLLDICQRGQKNHSIVEDVRSALASKADPNAGLASPAFNDYTPLMLLAMAQPCANSSQIAKAMEVLIMAGADVHRECGQMPTGQLVPLRFAARVQNLSGLAMLHRYIDLGDTFQWASGENAENVMVYILQQSYGEELADRLKAMNPCSINASVQLRLFASPLVAGTLSPDTARRLCAGKWADPVTGVTVGEKADPNSPGLEGRTALMNMVIDGNVAVVESLLAGRASTDQRDSSGATPLHYAACHVQPAVARVLLRAGAEPHAVDHAGFSPWMVVGEARCFDDKEPGSPIGHGRDRAMDELFDLLKPDYPPEYLLNIAEENIDMLFQLLRGRKVSIETMEAVFRIQESLFFNPRMAVQGSFEGRFPLQHLLSRVSEVLIKLLQIDPLEGDLKILTRYLLTATKGPDSCASCAHIAHHWTVDDNRIYYRKPLMEAVKSQLWIFGSACGKMREQIHLAAEKAQRYLQSVAILESTEQDVEVAKDSLDEVEDEAPPTNLPGDTEVADGPILMPAEQDDAAAPSVELEALTDFPPPPPEPLEPVDSASLACAALLQLDDDCVDIPKAWRQEDPYWEEVQRRQVLRYDPPWAMGICDGASACLQLIRLGVPKDAKKTLPKKELMCVVSNLADYSALRQVNHSSMHEIYGRGYVTYSNLCNKPFQDKMMEIAARARDNAGLDVGFPKDYIGAKKLARIMEKTKDAQSERNDWEWPNRSNHYLRCAYCFYILDTVRLSFGCRGASIPEQVQCCMRLLEEFENCSLEKDGVALLRKKSGFSAKAAKAAGGYADVKMLVFADLGVHVAFDGTEIPLRVVGEVQLILEGYEAVKHRMHLVYEVDRGSFDRRR